MLKDYESAPGKNRTCGPLFRRQVLYPLSYRRARDVDSRTGQIVSAKSWWRFSFK